MGREVWGAEAEREEEVGQEQWGTSGGRLSPGGPQLCCEAALDSHCTYGATEAQRGNHFAQDHTAKKWPNWSEPTSGPEIATTGPGCLSGRKGTRSLLEAQDASCSSRGPRLPGSGETQPGRRKS